MITEQFIFHFQSTFYGGWAKWHGGHFDMPWNLYHGKTLNSIMFYEVYLQEFFYFNTFFPRLNDGMGVLLSRTPPSYVDVDVDVVIFSILKDKMQKLCWIRLWQRSFVKHEAKYCTTCIRLIPCCSEHYCKNTMKQSKRSLYCDSFSRLAWTDIKQV